jgi:hypothetical protein
VTIDALLLRLHTETACPRGGALGVRLMDLDVGRGLVRLTEKAAPSDGRRSPSTSPRTSMNMPTTPGAVLPTDPLLRYRDGRRLTSRRYDHLWKRIGERAPWVAAQGISTHWLRHTTLTWVERHFGYGIARAYAGHTDSVGPATTTYIKADLESVATALAAMTGQPHPLAVWATTCNDELDLVSLTVSGAGHAVAADTSLVRSRSKRTADRGCVAAATSLRGGVDERDAVVGRHLGLLWRAGPSSSPRRRAGACRQGPCRQR